MSVKKAKKQNLEKEYAKVISGNEKILTEHNGQQWSANGDFFNKFSLYRETSSGLTSANTVYRP